MEYPKEKILAGFDGHKRKWRLVKVYENYGLYKCGEIRECFNSQELGLIKKRDVTKLREAQTESRYWNVGISKTMRENFNNLQEIELLGE